ncbi:MAG: fibronectin type III domain-containing protein [Pseudomonadota bacterium]
MAEQEISQSPIHYGWDASIDLGTRGDYYVDAARGDDTGDGTSPKTAKKTIQAAIALARPGNKIKIRGGTYEEAVSLAGIFGTPSSPIIIERYAAEHPVITGQSALTGWSACTKVDSVFLGPKWKNCFKISKFPKLRFAAENPLAMNPHEAGTRLNVATDRANTSNLFWISWVESFHGYPDPAGITFQTDDAGHVNRITHTPVLRRYSTDQLLEASVRYYTHGNSTEVVPITGFNGTDTIAISGRRGPLRALYRYSLENIGPAIAPGQFAFTNNRDGTVNIYVYPARATTPEDLDATMTYAQRSVGIDIADASYVTIRGIETFGQAGDGGDAGTGFATQSSPTGPKYDIKLEHCRASNTFAVDAAGYGGFYLASVTNLTVKHCEVEGAQGGFGMYIAGLGSSPNLRHLYCKAIRTNNAAYRYFGQHDGVSAFNYAVDCGLDTHANKTNVYENSNHFVFWAHKYDNCRGYLAIQRSSNITVAFCQIPVSPREESGSGDGRGIQVQQKNPIPNPQDPSLFYNNVVLPQIPVEDVNTAINFSDQFNIEPLFAFNNVAHGITTDVGKNGAGYVPAIEPAPITTDYNVITNILRSQVAADFGDNSVVEKDLDEVVENAFRLDYAPPQGSPILTTRGRDMSDLISRLKARFPDIAQIFDRDLNGQLIDWTIPFVGNQATLLFAHDAPARVEGIGIVAGQGELVLSWRTPGDGGSEIQGYLVHRSSDEGKSWSEVSVGPLPNSTFIDTKVKNPSSYVYRVAAINKISQGRWSERVSGTPL